jgi:hypothetical protein
MFSPTRDVAVRFILSHFCTATARFNRAWDVAARFILGECYTATEGYSPAGDMRRFCSTTAGYSQAGNMDELVSCVTSALLKLVPVPLATRINFVS